ncbi:hypothetical protein ACIBI3_12325 [Actinomadura luteofluorescens]|uniref:hypothetical protein n=1 Tax=Actinomadura luteofluorescens TaxID=46163 RepID=UPI003489D7B1
MPLPAWLSAGPPTLAKAFDDLSRQPLLDSGRFIPRNFLLEERPPDFRTERYVEGASEHINGIASAEMMAQLTAYHNGYVRDFLQQGTRTDRFSQEDDECPETFRGHALHPGSGLSDQNLELGTLEIVHRIARDSAEPREEVLSLLSRIAGERRAGLIDKGSEKDLDHLLQSWQQTAHNGPMRAFFWEDLESVLTSLDSGWPDKVRDRLGLIHLDPTMTHPGAGIDVCVFRYSIKRVPKELSGNRLAVRPTVFDDFLGENFCTSQPDGGFGYSVDLTESDELVREVVHPAIKLRANEVWATGSIRARPASDPMTARTYHLLKMSQFCDASFQAAFEETDEDLF